MPARTRKANAAKSAVRGHVEHVFAYQKGPMGMVARTIGIARTKATLTLVNMAYNMKRCDGSTAELRPHEPMTADRMPSST